MGSGSRGAGEGGGSAAGEAGRDYFEPFEGGGVDAVGGEAGSAGEDDAEAGLADPVGVGVGADHESGAAVRQGAQEGRPEHLLTLQPASPQLAPTIDLGARRPKGMANLHLELPARGTGDAVVDAPSR